MEDFSQEIEGLNENDVCHDDGMGSDKEEVET